MTTTLKSNWMGNRNAAPVKFRASSNGSVFTRTEKLANIFAARKRAENKANRMEIILQARNQAKEEKAKRERFFAGQRTLLDHPEAKIRHSKDGLYIQPRQNGSFGKKIEL